MRAGLLALIAGLALGCAVPAPAAAPAAGGARLPAVAVVDLDRAPRSVEAVRAGRVALVTFWATWCDACRKELGALNRLDERATGEHAVVIGVAVGEPAAAVRAFVERNGLRYAQLVDEELRFSDALGQRSLPATLVVGRSGEIVYSGGALDAAALAALRAALRE
jgi:peroxiredoxin